MSVRNPRLRKTPEDVRVARNFTQLLWACDLHDWLDVIVLYLLGCAPSSVEEDDLFGTFFFQESLNRLLRQQLVTVRIKHSRRHWRASKQGVAALKRCNLYEPHSLSLRQRRDLSTTLKRVLVLELVNAPAAASNEEVDQT